MNPKKPQAASEGLRERVLREAGAGWTGEMSALFREAAEALPATEDDDETPEPTALQIEYARGFGDGVKHGESNPAIAPGGDAMSPAFMADVCDAAIQAMQANGLTARTIRLQEVRDQLRLAALPPAANAGAVDDAKIAAGVWRHRRLSEIKRIIETVDNRAMACDGPVRTTMQEMTQAEMSRIYDLARGVDCTALAPAAASEDDPILAYFDTCAPADPPAAGDALPPLPKEAAAYQVGCNQRIWPGDFLYTADQMRAYALAAQEAARG